MFRVILGLFLFYHKLLMRMDLVQETQVTSAYVNVITHNAKSVRQPLVCYDYCDKKLLFVLHA